MKVQPTIEADTHKPHSTVEWKFRSAEQWFRKSILLQNFLDEASQVSLITTTTWDGPKFRLVTVLSDAIKGLFEFKSKSKFKFVRVRDEMGLGFDLFNEKVLKGRELDDKYKCHLKSVLRAEGESSYRAYLKSMGKELPPRKDTATYSTDTTNISHVIHDYTTTTDFLIYVKIPTGIFPSLIFQIQHVILLDKVDWRLQSRNGFWSIVWHLIAGHDLYGTELAMLLVGNQFGRVIVDPDVREVILFETTCQKVIQQGLIYPQELPALAFEEGSLPNRLPTSEEVKDFQYGDLGIFHDTVVKSVDACCNKLDQLSGSQESTSTPMTRTSSTESMEVETSNIAEDVAMIPWEAEEEMKGREYRNFQDYCKASFCRGRVFNSGWMLRGVTKEEMAKVVGRVYAQDGVAKDEVACTLE